MGDYLFFVKNWNFCFDVGLLLFDIDIDIDGIIFFLGVNLIFGVVELGLMDNWFDWVIWCIWDIFDVVWLVLLDDGLMLGKVERLGG